MTTLQALKILKPEVRRFVNAQKRKKIINNDSYTSNK